MKFGTKIPPQVNYVEVIYTDLNVNVMIFQGGKSRSSIGENERAVFVKKFPRYQDQVIAFFCWLAAWR